MSHPLPGFPQRLPEKLKAIREKLRLSPDEFAPRVGAKNGEEILSYENNVGELPARMFWRYLKVADVPLENLWDDKCDLWFGYRTN